MSLPPGGPDQDLTLPGWLPFPDWYPQPGPSAWAPVAPWTAGMVVQGSTAPRTCVTHLGSTYVALADDPDGVIEPGVTALWENTWQQVSAKGDQGPPGGALVTSVFGRQGDVVPAAGDYTPAEVGADPAGTAAALVDAETVRAQGAEAALVPIAEKGAVNGVATLDAGGKIPGGQLPAIAVNNVFPAVADQPSMLALPADVGDVAVRNDVNRNFMLRVLPATDIANWVELADPASPVTSVFGRVGAVALQKADVTGTGLAAADVAADAAGAAAGVQVNLTAEVNRAVAAEAALAPRANPVHTGAVTIVGGAAPGTPAAGNGAFYVDATGNLHYVGPNGTDTQIADA
jgi:hypothetical protein